MLQPASSLAVSSARVAHAAPRTSIPRKFLENSWKIQHVRLADRAAPPNRRLSPAFYPFSRSGFEQELRTRSKRMDAQGDEEENAARLEKEASSVRRGAAAMHQP